MNVRSKPHFHLIAIAAGVVTLGLSISGCRKTAAPVDDATLNTNVQSKISSDASLSDEDIRVGTTNGVVVLYGVVNSDAERTAAGNDAMQVPGIKILNNMLAVQIPPPTLTAPPPPPAPAPPKKSKPAAGTPAPPPGPYQQAPAPIVDNAPPPPPPPPPVKPVVKPVTVTLAEGTVLPVRTTEALDSGTTQQGSAFHGVLAADVTDANGNLALAAGTPVTGTVTTVQDAAHFKGSALLTVTLASVSFKGDRIPIATDPYSVQGKGRGKNTAEKVGGGAAVGAILGGIFGGGKGAAIGAAAGGGLGAGANAVTKGQEVSIPSESIVRFKLTNALSVTH